MAFLVSTCLSSKESAELFPSGCADECMMDLFLCFFPALPVVMNIFFSFSFSNRFVVMSRHGFNSHFPNC